MSYLNLLDGNLNFNLQDSAINFCDLVYFTLPKQALFSAARGRSTSSQKVNQLLSELSYIGSSDRSKSFYKMMIPLVSKIPRISTNNLCLPDFNKEINIISRSASNDLERLVVSTSSRLGYTDVGFYLSEFGNGNFVGAFIFLFDSKFESIEENSKINFIPQYLDLLHFYCLRSLVTTNVEIDSPKGIPSKTLNIVKLTSRGASSKEIAEKLHLTTRGVEYHLEKARRILNASNKVELISLAKDSCLI